MNKQIKKKIIFPLDVPTIESAENWVKKLNGHVGIFKVGLELFVSEGPSVLQMINNSSEAGIFLDLKLHDIPATMAGALMSASRYSPRFITIHPDLGSRLKESVNGIQSKDTTVLGVSVLTSISSSDLHEMGIDKKLTMEELVDLRVNLSRKAGCGGIVCSGLEVRRIRKKFGQEIVIVVPGIRPSFSVTEKEDQKRITTPGEAIYNGADYLVVGRPIRNAKDPVAAAQNIAEEIEKAVRDKAN